MSKYEKKQEKSPVKGQDFADPNEELNDKPSSHGEVANQKGSDFSELEESRMDNPPEKRDTNGSENSGTDTHADTQNQENGIT